MTKGEDIGLLLPPPVPLPTDKYSPEDTVKHKILVQNIKGIRRLIKKKERAKEEVKETEVEEENNEELIASKILAEALNKENISSLYSLEFKDLYHSR